CLPGQLCAGAEPGAAGFEPPPGGEPAWPVEPGLAPAADEPLELEPPELPGAEPLDDAAEGVPGLKSWICTPVPLAAWLSCTISAGMSTDVGTALPRRITVA